MKILPLFPTAVGMFDLDREFTKSELKFINSQKLRPNMGNKTSQDYFILKNNQLKKLHQFCLKSANSYFQEIYKPKKDLELYITQSWCNYTEKGEYHHKHFHSNSFISGVLYINADLEKDKIYFFNNEYKQIRVESLEFNPYNSESWWFKIKTGTLILFPSKLEHMVENVISDKTRISLSFNTFLRGTIGNLETLSGLTIGE
jgi:uncharacterized protein (TIGR02466 family)